MTDPAVLICLCFSHSPVFIHTGLRKRVTKHRRAASARACTFVSIKREWNANGPWGRSMRLPEDVSNQIWHTALAEECRATNRVLFKGCWIWKSCWLVRRWILNSCFQEDDLLGSIIRHLGIWEAHDDVKCCLDSASEVVEQSCTCTKSTRKGHF